MERLELARDLTCDLLAAVFVLLLVCAVVTLGRWHFDQRLCWMSLFGPLQPALLQSWLSSEGDVMCYYLGRARHSAKDALRPPRTIICSQRRLPWAAGGSLPYLRMSGCPGSSVACVWRGKNRLPRLRYQAQRVACQCRWSTWRILASRSRS